MHWALYVLLGATLNVAVNFGYKSSAGKEDVFLMTAGVLVIASLILMTFSFQTRGHLGLGILTRSYTPLIILGMGVGTALVLYMFINAFAKGPLSLVDPMWACIYTFLSALIGMWVLRETPSATSLVGIGLYLVGAVLMSRG